MKEEHKHKVGLYFDLVSEFINMAPRYVEVIKKDASPERPFSVFNHHVTNATQYRAGFQEALLHIPDENWKTFEKGITAILPLIEDYLTWYQDNEIDLKELEVYRLMNGHLKGTRSIILHYFPIENLKKTKTSITKLKKDQTFKDLFSESYSSKDKIDELKEVLRDSKLTNENNIWIGTQGGGKNELSTICHYLQGQGVFKVPMDPKGLKVFFSEFGLQITPGDRKSPGDYANVATLSKEFMDLKMEKRAKEIFTFYLKENKK